MKRSEVRPRLILVLGAAMLLGASLLLVLSPVEGLMLNAGNTVSAVAPPLPSQEPVGRLAPTRPPPLNPLPPHTGFTPLRLDLSHLKGNRMPEGVRAAALPVRWDWREHGVVTRVQNQGNCGACYAFASLANFESKLQIDGAGRYDFSENNAKECPWHDPGCGGSNYWEMAAWLSQKGTVLESCDPYVGSNVNCNDTCPYVKTLLDWRVISEDQVPHTNVLKGYIQTYGPLYASMYAGDDSDRDWWQEFSNYDGSYTLYYAGVHDPNHAVLIVGWDDSLSHAGGSGGWIVKNSWGADWGATCGYGAERGYFTIAYGSAGIGKNASFVYAWQDYNENGDIMHYDEVGLTDAWGCGETTAWGLCEFIPWRDTYVTRVEFYTTDRTTDVDVYIYDDFEASVCSRLLWSSFNHTFEEAGYHGVTVNPPLTVSNGDDVIAVVKFTNESFEYPIPVDAEGPSENQRTYASCSGSNCSWKDVGADYEADVAIRLRTSDVVPPTPTATPTPPGARIYLPLVMKDYAPGAPTPTPTPTPTITPMNTPGPNVGAAHGRILWNDEGASGAHSRLCQDYNWISGTCSGRQYDTTTGASGWYEFTDVMPDSYCHLVRLAAEPVWWYKSFIIGCSEITISAGKVTKIDDFHVPKTDLCLLSPPDESTLDTNQPTLVWAAYPSAAYYKVYLRRESPSPETILNWVRVDDTAITAPDPLSGGRYRWSVNAYNANGRRIAYSARDYYFTVPGTPGSNPDVYTPRDGGL